MNDFDLKKFLVENKLTPQSLLNESEDDEYNIDASPEWNAREVTVGSKISVDDFKPEIISSLVNWGNWLKNQPPHIDIFKNGFIITGIKYKDKYFVVRINGTGKYLTYNFDELDPNKVTLVSESITEQDDYEEFTIDSPSEEWNAREVTVGSEIFISDFILKNISSFITWAKWLRNQPPYIDVFYNGLTISKIDFKSKSFTVHVNGTDKYIPYFSFDDLDPNKVTLVSSLTEQDDYEEFTIDSPSEEWNAQELTVGSVVTPDMWSESTKNDSNNLSTPWYARALKEPVTITNIEYDSEVFYTRDNSGEFNNTAQWFFNELNPSKAYIIPFEEINESDEDEFNVTPSKEWYVQELTVGSVITPDMWTKKAKKDPMNLERKRNLKAFSQNVVIKQLWDKGYIFETVPENDEDGEMAQWYSTELDPTKAIIVQDPNLFESDEDDFSEPIEASPEWGAQELTVGSTITPDMWSKEAKNSYYNNSHINNKIALMEPVKIIEIESDRGNNEDFVIMAQDKNGNRSYWSYRELDHTKAYIAPESITEQDEDDFSEPIEASPEWGAQELTIGSRVTPDMWNKEAYDYFSKYGPKWVIRPEVNAVIYEIEEDGNGDIWIKLLWKPKKENKATFPYRTDFINTNVLNNAYIVPPLNESNEDDFNVVPDEKHWNQEQFEGSDFEDFARWIEKILKKHGHNDHYIILDYIRDVLEFWEEGTYNGIEEHDLIDDFNIWLGDYYDREYEYEGLDEQDEDDFDITPSEAWDAKELTVGSVITPDMWSEEAKNDYTNVNQEKYAIAFSQNVVIKQLWDKGYTFGTVPENDENGEMVPWYSTELDPTKAYIKGSEQDPNLFESDEDDFDNPIEASPEWGAQELTTKEGSNIITPDMWAKKEITMKVYPELFKNNFKITKIDDDGFFINKKVNGKYGTTSWTTSYFSFDDLDPTKVYIVPQN